jgi:hypothetical protein
MGGFYGLVKEEMQPFPDFGIINCEREKPLHPE